MPSELIVLANATHAYLMSRASQPQATLQTLATLEYPAGRFKGMALTSDRPGHGAIDNKPGGVNFSPRLDSRRKQHQIFAREIAQSIEGQLTDGNFGAVSIFASSPFLGELKSRLGPLAQRRLRASIDADFTAFKHHDLDERVQAALRWERGAGTTATVT